MGGQDIRGAARADNNRYTNRIFPSMCNSFLLKVGASSNAILALLGAKCTATSGAVNAAGADVDGKGVKNKASEAPPVPAKKPRGRGAAVGKTSQ